MREGQVEVLVVGAGPVGLWTALVLADEGAQVAIIDQQSRTAARSYACALHPQTLKLLDRFGLVPALAARGRRVSKVAFYDREKCRGKVDLAKSGGDLAHLLIVPQNALEEELEKRLRQAGVTVHWNHRFDSLAEEDHQVIATVEELGGTGTGYIVPHWEMVVKRRSPVRAQFIVGADGHNSLVRQRLGIKWRHAGQRETFAAYEFESDSPGEDEVRVLLDGATTNVLWPLPNNRLRWTFQLTRSAFPGELPEKERRAVRLEEPQIDETIRQQVQRVAGQRAPWFQANVRKVDWCSEVAFERRVVENFGRGRCWLAGDAAHQTGPVGVQSMNGGFREACDLAKLIQGVLHEKTRVESLAQYDRAQQDAWQQLLGLTGGLRPLDNAGPWAREHCAQILPCLPGLLPEFPGLAAELGLELAPAALAQPAH
ncbi:MAG TPA: NAD(P)/FAD-dependent oxidoreductase [Verrucomicrobiae bacterium]|nr:NAD(P)/FAD-dependent oxidoreductase [Verrucomicrobiae bacterium]